MKKVFAVILNYNGYDDTMNCLNSILREDHGAVYPVIVDNASPDGSGEKLKTALQDIPVILNDENTGYAGGMNTGARFALEHGADFVLYVNNDTEFSGCTISELVKVAEKDARIGIVSPKVLYLDEREKIYCAGSKYLFYRCGNVSLGKGTDAQQNRNEEEEITHAEGACLLIKRAVFETVGYMREFFFMYFEDLEYSLRVNKKFKIVYAPKAVMYHQSGAGKSFEEYSLLYHYYFTRNRFLIFRNHGFFAKIYVILYSTAITLLKTAAIIKGAREKGEALEALLGGYKAGLAIMMGTRKLDETKPLKKN